MELSSKSAEAEKMSQDWSLLSQQYGAFALNLNSTTYLRFIVILALKSQIPFDNMIRQKYIFKLCKQHSRNIYQES